MGIELSILPVGVTDKSVIFSVPVLTSLGMLRFLVMQNCHPDNHVWGGHLSPFTVLLIGVGYTEEAIESAEESAIQGVNRNKGSITVATFTESGL